jgi:expansin (peptidoglycan-binding protein)
VGNDDAAVKEGLVRRRWWVASVAAGFLVAAGLVASLILLLLPDPGTSAGHAAATPSGDGQVALVASPGTPATSPGATAPSTTAGPTTATGSKTPSATASASTTVPAPASGPARLAGRIRPGVTYRGVATFYGADGGGNCMFDPSANLMVAAMNHADYEGSKACGAYVLVRAANGATVTVRITDQCPECAVGQLDLSAQAFAKLAAPSAGRIAITWKLLSPTTSTSIAVRYKTGSSRYWCAIQVINHRNPLAQLEIRSGNTWRQLSRSDYNYFVSPGGAGCGGSIRMTDIYGQRLVLDGLSVKAGVVQTTKAQFAKH